MYIYVDNIDISDHYQWWCRNKNALRCGSRSLGSETDLTQTCNARCLIFFSSFEIFVGCSNGHITFGRAGVFNVSAAVMNIFFIARLRKL